MKDLKRLKILVLTVIVPYPANDGGKICMFGFIDFLRPLHEFSILFPVYNTRDVENAEELARTWPDVNVRWVKLFETAIVTPENIPPKRTFLQRSLGFLVRQIQQPIVEEKPLVAAQTNKSDEESFISNLNNSFPFYPYPLKYIQALESEFVSNKYDIIQVSLTRNLNLVQILPKESKKIFEQIESRFDMLRDYMSTKNMNNQYSDYIVQNCELIENAFISHYDAVFTLNEEDKEYLQSHVQGPKVYCSPFGVLNRDIRFEQDKADNRRKIIFSGNEAHYPNYDALSWYLENVHNAVISLHNNIQLSVTGHWTAESISYFTSKYEAISFVGIVEDYAEFLFGSIMIAPIRIGGGGLRTKILYAMANGVPVVSSSLGAHGINASKGRDILIADEPSVFADSINGLIDSNKLYHELSGSGHQLVKDYYSQTYTSELRNRFYQQIAAS